jgi:hypothetical protein
MVYVQIRLGRFGIASPRATVLDRSAAQSLHRVMPAGRYQEGTVWAGVLLIKTTRIHESTVHSVATQ